MLDFLNPTSPNFILYKVIKFLGDILNFLNPFSEDFILKYVIEFLGNLVSYINPFSSNFIGYKLIELLGNLLKSLFIPKQESLTQFQAAWQEKLGFIDSIKISINSIQNMLNNVNDVPEYKLNINSKYYNGELTVMSLNWYTPFKPYGDLVITGFVYILFIFRIFTHLPGIISGTGSVIDTINDKKN